MPWQKHVARTVGNFFYVVRNPVIFVAVVVSVSVVVGVSFVVNAAVVVVVCCVITVVGVGFVVTVVVAAIVVSEINIVIHLHFNLFICVVLVIRSSRHMLLFLLLLLMLLLLKLLLLRLILLLILRLLIIRLWVFLLKFFRKMFYFLLQLLLSIRMVFSCGMVRFLSFLQVFLVTCVITHGMFVRVLVH